MNHELRISLLASVAAHLALLWGAGLLYAPASSPDVGAAVVAVRILADEGSSEPPPPKRVQEERPLWTPREAPTPVSRMANAAPKVGREHVEAAHPVVLSPRGRQETRPERAAHLFPLLPTPVGAYHAIAPIAAPQPLIEEEVVVGQPGGGAPGSRPVEGAGKGDPQPAPPRTDTLPGPGVEAVAASVLTHCKPAYPRQSRLLGEQGTVILSVEIGADGRPGAVVVTTSSGHTRLDAAAIQSLRKATFVPARRGGRPVPSLKRIAIAFRLTDAPEDDAEE